MGVGLRVGFCMEPYECAPGGDKVERDPEVEEVSWRKTRSTFVFYFRPMEALREGPKSILAMAVLSSLSRDAQDL